MNNNNKRKGLTVIFTGDGKGKTSAALGVVARCLGHGGKCKIIQFIKGKMNSGELHLTGRLGPELEIVRVGKGFTWKTDVPHEDHAKAAQDGLAMAREAVESGKYDTVVLDEILYALKAELVTIESVEDLIEIKPDNMHLILTGRGAPQRLIDMADLVTNMTMVKHHKDAGIPAQECMDF